MCQGCVPPVCSLCHRANRRWEGHGQVCPSHCTLLQLHPLHCTKSTARLQGLTSHVLCRKNSLTFHLPRSVKGLYCAQIQIHHELSGCPASRPVLHLHLCIRSGFLLDNVSVIYPKKDNLCVVIKSGQNYFSSTALHSCLKIP